MSEWPTLALLALCYLVWALGTTVLAAAWLPLGVAATALAVALHASLQHEVIHGHPFRARWLNEALVFAALNLAIPYERFRDTHLEHHYDAELTDPYDDPESNYLGQAEWGRLPGWLQRVLRFNNTLLGRLLIGPVVAQVAFMRAELRRGRPALRGWAMHGAGVALVLAWLLGVGAMPVWAYALAAYLSLSIVKIRTFLEHQAHEKARGRTVIIEDRGPLALVFLNNNFHAVHHMHPNVPWFQLPALYARRKARFLECNGGYVYRSYGEVFRRHFLTPKDAVAHPLWHRD